MNHLGLQSKPTLQPRSHFAHHRVDLYHKVLLTACIIVQLLLSFGATPSAVAASDLAVPSPPVELRLIFEATEGGGNEE